jgi:hypothetical protein
MTTFLIIAFFAAVAFWVFFNYKADEANIKTAWYSRHVGVVPVLPESPFDNTVAARTEIARQLFEQHGNTNVEVVPYFFGLPIGKDGTAALTFDAFLRIAAVDYLQRCDAFIADKAKKDQKAAAQHIGGQTEFVITAVSNKDFLK